MVLCVERLLPLPTRSFFLFGPRGCGKSTWLRTALPKAVFIDLLDMAVYQKLSADPHYLDELCSSLKEGDWVVLDEVQKVPMLLDEVHRLIEGKGLRFALCGSSARKLMRGGANLLGGRAILKEMEGFGQAELGADFNLQRALNFGTLPVVLSDAAHSEGILSTYAGTFLREELLAEGLIRKAEPFSRFLKVAGHFNGQILNAQNVATEAMVSRNTVLTYFDILRDSHLAYYLPAWRPGFKVRETTHPKFYWFDPGVARAAADLLRDPTDRLWQGFALETLVFQELRAYNRLGGRQRPLYYYRSPAGAEIDFVIEVSPRRQNSPPVVIALEVKLSSKWKPEWERTMHSLSEIKGVKVARKIGVYCGDRKLSTRGTEVYPVERFLRALHSGDLF